MPNLFLKTFNDLTGLDRAWWFCHHVNHLYYILVLEKLKSFSLTGGLTLEVSVENFEARVTPTFTKKLLKWSAIPFGQVTSIPSSVTSLFTLVVVFLPFGTSVF